MNTKVADALKGLIDALQTEVAAAPPEGRPVIVCTDKRGVFFGYAKDTTGDPIVLDRPRMAVYWSSDVKGVLGLAATGPSASCRIGPCPPRIELREITCVMDVTPEAVKAWEGAPWAS